MAGRKKVLWILGLILLAVILGGFLTFRSGEQNSVLYDLGIERGGSEVLCSNGPGPLVFSGTSQSRFSADIKRAMIQNAARFQATLSVWRPAQALGTLSGEEADWTRGDQRYVVRLVAPQFTDEDATICLFERPDTTP
ncbi:hypothetical protein [Deinococcus arcticus]|uniref:Uncharacterized protein n=1 Tax=Deinococcus arcticus TaxID=2136176 RepID=A0A2T3W8J3_9DEIO|nr:hypothetical protein [Deinococcus arcticus]PTA68220.1 hypothetical protein C8263_09180 [Deinococcus arcticus]